MRKYLNFTKITGTTTGVSTNRLIDANADFTGGTGVFRVYPGDVVIRETGEYATAIVREVVSPTELRLSSHIFTASGQKYRIRAGFATAEGTTTGTATGKLIDANANFQEAGVRPGFTVQVGEDVATVEAVESATQLALSRDIAGSTGLAYKVYPGEWVFVEAVEEYRASTRRLLGADSTELQASTAQDLKTLPFFHCPSYGLSVATIFLVCEAKVSGGTGSVSLKVDGSTLGSASVTSTSYTVIKIKGNPNLSGEGAHELAVAVSPPNGGSISVRLTEIFASEVVE